MTTEKPNPDESLIRDLSYPALDGLRFFAAMLVFLVHSVGVMMTDYFSVPEKDLTYDSANPLYSLTTYLSDGHHGVDIFFVISGFLMARIVFGREIGWWAFVWKRFKRIYPAFFVSLVLVAAANCLLFGWEFKWRDFGLNLVFYNALPDNGIIPYNYVTWSLGYEFAFYLLVPLLGYAARYIDRRIVAAAALCIVLAYIPDSVCRFSGLFVGLLIGSFDEKLLLRIAGHIPAVLVVGLYFILMVAKGYWPLQYLAFYHWLLLLIPVGFISIAFGDNWLGRLFSIPILRKLGTLSYSFYLFHSICIVLVMHYLLVWLGVKGNPWIAMPIYFAASFLLAVAVSYVSYKLLEAPYFRSHKNTIGPSVST